jgi:hypothetical protein
VICVGIWPLTELLPNLLPKEGKRGDFRGRRASSIQQLTDFYRRLCGFSTHCKFFRSVSRLESCHNVKHVLPPAVKQSYGRSE